MIDVHKTRLWEVSFALYQTMDSLAYPTVIAEEVEGVGYRMPHYTSAISSYKTGGQIAVTLSGRGILNINRHRYSLVPGTAFLYRNYEPGVSYYYPSDGTEKWRFLWANFGGDASDSLLTDICNRYGHYFDLRGNCALENQMMHYKEYAGRMLTLTPLEGARLVLDLLEKLNLESNTSDVVSSRERLVKEVQKSFTEIDDENHTTVNLARKLGISREHLSRSFKEALGRSLRDCRIEKRLGDAVFLLTKTNLNCKEIAARVGFGCYSSFFRAFLKHYCESPEDYRQKTHGKI